MKRRIEEEKDETFDTINAAMASAAVAGDRMAEGSPEFVYKKGGFMH